MRDSFNQNINFIFNIICVHHRILRMMVMAVLAVQSRMMMNQRILM